MAATYIYRTTKRRNAYVPRLMMLVCQTAQLAHSDDLKLGEKTATQQ